MSWIKDVLGLKPSRKEFAEIAKTALRQFGETRELRFNEEQFSISVHDQSAQPQAIYFLENSYEAYCSADAADKKAVLQAFFEKQPELPEKLDEAISSLLPRLQPRSFYEEMPLRRLFGELPGSNEDADMCRFQYITLAEHLAVGQVFDTANSVLQISNHALKGWSTTLNELMPRALTNLEKLTPHKFESIKPGVYISNLNDTHDASRLMLKERILECRVDGRPVAVAPNRNTLVVTGEDDLPGQSLMLEIAEKCLSQPRPMPVLPLVFAEGEWQSMPIKPDHPEKNRFDYLRAVGMSDIYNTQKQLLEKLHEQEGKDVFVATYTATKKNDTGEIMCYCAWTEGVEAMLPEVGRVAFVSIENGKPQSLGMVPWDIAMKVAGNLLKPLDMYPKRYLVNSFPTKAQLDQMQQ